MNMMLLKPGTEDTSSAKICNVLNQNNDEIKKPRYSDTSYLKNIFGYQSGNQSKTNDSTSCFKKS